MQMVKNSLIMFTIVWLAIFLFMPKQEIYYKIERELLEHNIELNEASIDEGLFSLTLKGVAVYAKGINVANIKQVDLLTLLFYSSVQAQALHLSDSLKSMVSGDMKGLVLSHSILSPLNILVSADGSFGSLRGNMDISERKIHLDFNESKNIEVIKKYLKKSEKGWYYETSF